MYIGLDFETTGLDPLRHLPLTLGLAWEAVDVAGGRVRMRGCEFEFQFNATRRWDVEAMLVNELAPTVRTFDISNGANIIPPEQADSYDLEICQFFMEQGWSPFDKKLVPVGWNVGGFDMRFMQTFFPQASKFFSHRYLELNSMLYVIEAMQFSVDKENLKAYAVEQAKADGIPVNWHNAEWDAIASLYAKCKMDEIIHYVAENDIHLK